jgi:hypothetical protein
MVKLSTVMESSGNHYLADRIRAMEQLIEQLGDRLLICSELLGRNAERRPSAVPWTDAAEGE